MQLNFSVEIGLTGYPYLNRSIVCEFHGIDQQVDQYLTKPGNIAFEAWRNRFIQVIFDYQPFLIRCRFNQIYSSGNAFTQMEGLALQLHLASFNLGKVKYLIYD